MKRTVIILAAVLCIGLTPPPLPPPLPKKRLRAIDPKWTGAARLVAKPAAAVVQPPQVFVLTLKYAAGYTNGQTNFLTHDLMSSTNLKDWIVEQYHVEGQDIVVVTNKGEKRKFFRVRMY